MSGLQANPQIPVGTPAAFVLAWQARRRETARRSGWIEATMRRYETPNVVDLAKREDTLCQLSRLLGA